MYKLKPLPYKLSSLEPFIDTHTLGLHHKKHHENYLNKLNALLIKNKYDYRYPIEELSSHIMEFEGNDREDILFNLGGVINHNIYFESMSTKKEMPNIALNSKIIKTFGSFDDFKKAFKEKALAVKGSGYTFLVMDENKNLDIVNFYNQDCPYFHGLTALLCIDVWEHAYYINYENKRDLYIDNFFEIMDFSKANDKMN